MKRKKDPNKLMMILAGSFVGLMLILSIALYFLGGEIIGGFALALIIGVVIGTYSSIYVASTAVVLLGVSRSDLMPVKKPGAEAEERL